MIPEHLVFPTMSEVVAANRTRGVNYERVALLDRAAVKGGNAFTHVGTFEEILRQIAVREYPGCQQLILEPGWGSHPVLEVWRIPRFVGTDEDTLLYLLNAFGQVCVPDKDMRARLAGEFQSVLLNVGTCLMLKAHEEHERNKQKKKAERRQKLEAGKRAKTGRVYIRHVSWLIYGLIRVIEKSINSRVDVRLSRYTHGIERNTRTAIALLKAVERFGLLRKVPRVHLNVFRPFLAGLTRHEDALHRSFGRAVRRTLRKLKRRKK